MHSRKEFKYQVRMLAAYGVGDRKSNINQKLIRK